MNKLKNILGFKSLAESTLEDEANSRPQKLKKMQKTNLYIPKTITFRYTNGPTQHNNKSIFCMHRLSLNPDFSFEYEGIIEVDSLKVLETVSGTFLRTGKSGEDLHILDFKCDEHKRLIGMDKTEFCYRGNQCKTFQGTISTSGDVTINFMTIASIKDVPDELLTILMSTNEISSISFPRV